MPVRMVGIDQGSPEFGTGSFMMIADRSSFGSANDVTDIANFHSRRYNFQSLELSGNAPGIDVPIIGDSPSDFPSQQGPLDIINGFTLPGYVDSMEPFYRMLVNDERALDPTGTTAPTLDSSESGGVDAQIAADGVFSSGALSTTPVTTGFTAPTGGFPIRLVVDPSAAFDGRITLVGTDYSDTVITETLTYANSADAQTTTRFFKTVTSAVASGAVTVTIGGSDQASNRRYTSVFRENNAGQLLHGQDVYAVKGTVPNTYREVYLNGLSFSFSREGSIALAFTAVGKRPFANTNFTDNAIRVAEHDRTTTNAISSATRQAFVGWQSGVFWDDAGTARRLPIIDATFNLTNNIAFSPTVTGRRTPGGAFRTRRNVTLEGTMEYRSEDLNLIDDVLGNEFIENAYLQVLNVATGGFPYLTRYYFGRLQFVNLPDAPVSEEGIISRPVSMKAVESEDGTSPDVYIHVESTGNILSLGAITP